ncbi:MAG: AI-2E family transporter [Syntrophobacteraceae bacterium]|nr:AI-2E family transporter [Syntrophobacteraceae bacterium]
MALDLHQLFRTNKKAFIWAAFFILLYLVRKLFGLVFLTFILCYIFNNIVIFLQERVPARRRAHLVLVYFVFLSMLVGMLSIVMPRMATETKIFLQQLPESLDAMHRLLDEMAGRYSYLAPLFLGLKETLNVNNMLGINREALVALAVKVVNHVTQYVTYFFLGTVFSFTILFDLPNLSEKISALRHTRIRDVYEETAESVAKFSLVVGAAFQAQIFIATLNTTLTALGLWLLQIKPVALLSIIVFFAGLIPVLGIFISSVPILLLAFNLQGWTLALKAAGMIAIVHAVEAYFLNPNIFSAVLKINPVLTLIILYIGHTLFGLWGIILGVPVSVYIYRYILLAGNAVEAPSTPEATPQERVDRSHS